MRLFLYALCTLLIIQLSAACAFAAGFIAVDQAGFLPGDVKVAYITQQADSFYVIKKGTQTVMLAGRVELRKLKDPATGMDIYTADFSALNQPGSYQIRVPGVGTSYPFRVGERVHEELYTKSLRAFYFQRCGMELKVAIALQYNHPACHLQDGYYHASTGQSGQAPSTGGWHDAGDYGKYIVNGGISAGTLLMAFETFPVSCAADTLKIPESGNGVPDLLDEVRYELAWFLTMQEPDGGVHHKLTRVDFEAIIMPQKDTAKRYFMPVSSAATANFAAVMAMAGRIYRPFDAAFADTCLVRAEKAWHWLESHPDIVPVGGFKNPSGVSTGEYGDGDDRDERLWAAAELWRTSRKVACHRWYLDHYAGLNLFTAEMGWGSLAPLAHLSYLADTSALADQQVQGKLRDALNRYADGMLQQEAGSGFRYLLKPGEFNWGSNSRALNRAILLALAAEFGGRSRFRAAVLDQLHYMLGANPHNVSYITGIGTASMKNPHHRPSWSDNVPAPVPGLLAGGANQYLQDDALKATFTSSTPPALCWIDDANSYASNEICINWNAPLVFLAAWASAESGASGVGARPVPPVRSFHLGQNYPNPFNSTTVIPFRLEEEGEVTLQVYNICGELVDEQALGHLASGEQRHPWHARGPSGLYYYRIKIRSAGTLLTLAGKMAVVR
ncbi:MAG TPA: glycoside hydrolase family 9 protein [bacterium]|nr:glycoside hydrolase family 9 protein [bacterium]HQI48627.1 glycoside hydrolase family 9 protein [bacterium]HQJ63994.1 glycoside hydrolase family 9 protein [bacterium]